MSKTYIVSRNGGTVTKAPINDNKIPIYANETALDADLANIPDNTLVATRGGHDDVIDQMKDYIRKQNDLSELESYGEMPNNVNNPFVAEYDGYLIWMVGNFNQNLMISSDNGQTWQSFLSLQASGSYNDIRTIPIRKGDLIYTTRVEAGQRGNIYTRYYKNRDYTGR